MASNTTVLDAALEYAAKGWPVFPCGGHKRPLLKDWPNTASIDPQQLAAWWAQAPYALIGVPTGKASGFVVLDVDVKDPRAYGFDTLGELGLAILPVTRMAHTSSNGLHLHFALPDKEIRNTAGKKGRGIGPGLDWRGEGGYVIVPSDGSGYSWDPHCGLEEPLAAVPAALLPRQPERIVREPVEAVDGLSPYARTALDSACRNIIGAANGEQEFTLNAECFSIGQLAGSGAIPETFALRTLLWAASQICDYDPRRPWRKSEIEDKVKAAFADGAARPREARHG
jgi:putative DNA primase/helicase